MTTKVKKAANNFLEDSFGGYIEIGDDYEGSYDSFVAGALWLANKIRAKIVSIPYPVGDELEDAETMGWMQVMVFVDSLFEEVEECYLCKKVLNGEDLWVCYDHGLKDAVTACEGCYKNVYKDLDSEEEE